METMTDDLFQHEPAVSPVTPEVLLAEMRGLRLEQNARFDGMDREQSDMKAWLGRLSEALERQVQATTRLFSLEAIVSSVVTQVADLKLDVAAAKEDVIGLQKKEAQSSLLGKGVWAAAAAGFAALCTGLADHFFK